MVTVPKEVHTFGGRFSRDVHLIFSNPAEAVKVLIAEVDPPHALSVPLFVVITAAIMTVIGKYLVFEVNQTIVGGPYWLQLLNSVFQGLALTVDIIVTPIFLIFIWVFWAIVFHFLGSIVAGSDITGSGTFMKTLKLTGFIYAPMFLNILPILPAKSLYVMPVVTTIWSAWIAYLAMKENYKTTRNGALIITLPYLFTAFYGAFVFLSRIGS